MQRGETSDNRRWTRWSLRSLTSVLLAAAVFAGACGGEDDRQEGLRVVTSLEVFADMVRNVAGDRADVSALLPAGADPHTFELTPGRVAEVARADIAFINGLGLEGNVQDVIEENAGGPVVELTQGLDTIDGNPHLWLDVSKARRYVERIRDALSELNPAGRAGYEANARAYLQELAALDGEVEMAVNSIPPDNRKLVTLHDAFPYLAGRYGLEVVAVVAPSPGQEPSARRLAELTETLRSESVPTVFKEPQFNANVLELAAEDAGVRVLNLLSDAFVDDVNSYVELMRFNARQLQEGLGGD